MSDKFIAVATKEIHDDLDKIIEILNREPGDIEHRLTLEIKRSLHNVKGLAPMMGKEQVGILASLLDLLLKKSIDGVVVHDIFSNILLYTSMMKRSMNNDVDLQPFIKEISTKYAPFLS